MYLLTFSKNTPLAKVGIATREGSDLEAQAEPGISWAKSMPEEPASRASPHRVAAPGLHRAGGSWVRSHLTVAADPDEHAALWCCDFLAGSVTDVCPLAPWFQGPAEHPLSRFHWTNTSSSFSPYLSITADVSQVLVNSTMKVAIQRPENGKQGTGEVPSAEGTGRRP